MVNARVNIANLYPYLPFQCFPGSVLVKNLPACVGAARDAGLMPELGRSLEKEVVTHSSILAWKIPRTEEPLGLQSMESQSE